MIKINKLCKNFGNKKAVSNLSLEIPEGKIFGFLGPNGAGKSTTIKMITGIEKPTSGEIFINDIDIHKNSLLAKSQIAYIADEPTFYEYMTGIQYLNFISDIFSISVQAREDAITYYSKLFDLIDALNEFISKYSHGMKQKLSLIAAFIHSPKVIILDEPMVGLDAKSVKILKDTLKAFAANGNTVFYSTHVMDVAERFCDNFAIINKGELVYSGTFEDLKSKVGENDSTLEDLFLQMTEI
ncbi:ABC transporter ATP-binding protein [Fibrobacter sp. UWB7]|uniref:ABC transporter ATP-binding protein n=1 Tax=Fibrobacter sp. UWB7 TaxID=1896206 RepID=UPI0009150A73|nr:ABC transporter ATP-binding protein [Fibrobacter sp. UWB7]SHM20970.1 ABC-2 type transport system ATP-binding protein [Fibrobacter sp. UWB7]